MLHQEILATGEAKNLWLSYVVTVLDVHCMFSDSFGLNWVAVCVWCETRGSRSPPGRATPVSASTGISSHHWVVFLTHHHMTEKPFSSRWLVSVCSANQEIPKPWIWSLTSIKSEELIEEFIEFFYHFPSAWVQDDSQWQIWWHRVFSRIMSDCWWWKWLLLVGKWLFQLFGSPGK